MSDNSGKFFGGFIIGTLIGSALGVIFGSKLNETLSKNELNPLVSKDESTVGEEVGSRAKRTLEQKIAQLNSAIDAVSQELSVSQSNGQK